MAKAVDDLFGVGDTSATALNARAILEAARRARAALELFEKTEADRLAKEAFDRARQFVRNEQVLARVEEILFGAQAPADQGGAGGDVLNSGRRDP